jgi:hypothetical protein
MAVGPQRTSHPSGPRHPRFGGFLIIEDSESHVIPAKAGIHRTWVSAYARTAFVLRRVSDPRRPQSFALGQQADVRPSEDSGLDLLTSGLPTNEELAEFNPSFGVYGCNPPPADGGLRKRHQYGSGKDLWNHSKWSKVSAALVLNR